MFTATAMAMPEAPGVSTGFVLTRPDDNRSLDAYVAEVDQKMYREKRKKGWTYRKE